MGVKDSLMNKMLSSMLGKVDFDALQQQLGKNGGKIDSDMINSVMSSMLGGVNDDKSVLSNKQKQANTSDDKAFIVSNETIIDELVKKRSFGYEGICKFIPQRPPFLMIDKVLDLDVEKKCIVCQKVLSANDGFFVGHFPDHPVMPGVLMIEAMAQASSVIGRALIKDKSGVLLFAEVNNVRFSGIATVGDVLTIETYIDKVRDPLIIGRAFVKKNEEVVCKCELKAFRKEL